MHKLLLSTQQKQKQRKVNDASTKRKGKKPLTKIFESFDCQGKAQGEGRRCLGCQLSIGVKGFSLQNNLI